MEKRRKYHGWICLEKSLGFKDHFSIKHGKTIRAMGYGIEGADKSVAYFEDTLKLGHITLEVTPIGLRVFTEEEESQPTKAGPTEKREAQVVVEQIIRKALKGGDD